MKAIQSLNDERQSLLRLDCGLLEKRALNFFDKVYKAGKGGAYLSFDSILAIVHANYYFFVDSSKFEHLELILYISDILHEKVSFGVVPLVAEVDIETLFLVYQLQLICHVQLPSHWFAILAHLLIISNF